MLRIEMPRKKGKELRGGFFNFLIQAAVMGITYAAEQSNAEAEARRQQALDEWMAWVDEKNAYRIEMEKWDAEVRQMQAEYKAEQARNRVVFTKGYTGRQPTGERRALTVAQEASGPAENVTQQREATRTSLQRSRENTARLSSELAARQRAAAAATAQQQLEEETAAAERLRQQTQLVEQQRLAAERRARLAEENLAFQEAQIGQRVLQSTAPILFQRQMSSSLEEEAAKREANLEAAQILSTETVQTLRNPAAEAAVMAAAAAPLPTSRFARAAAAQRRMQPAQTPVRRLRGRGKAGKEVVKAFMETYGISSAEAKRVIADLGLGES